ncbi:threonine-phosphate decarboxylase CobD [Labrenzia sp. CE80]|uniref:threonine-phosphate decarboxylase CobD n=1 Tax=Labrenzia sp. CE80 TaxID=1788986 RepID=UPI00129AD576|nr:threonine-phosphate decarboxylase CobD [Labrenzia sp. CE80]
MLHGGDLSSAIERFGGAESDWLDLSTGINPHTYPLEASVSGSAWRNLPGQASLDHLIGAARRAYDCPESLALVAGPGTQILISQIPYLLPDGPVALCGPTYTSHALSFTRAGRTPEEVSTPHALPDRAKIAVIVNPNNPDGRLTDPQSLLAIARELTERGGALVLDEAFADVMPGSSLLPHITDENVVVLRSFGKFFGLAGLRLGFMAARPALARQMSERLDSWAVSSPALEIGRAALNDKDWQQAMVRQLADEMADLTICLGENGLGVFGGTPLYALAGHRDAHKLHDALARQHIWTRVFDYAPTWIRFGLPGSAEGLKRLAQALAEAQKAL